MFDWWLAVILTFLAGLSLLAYSLRALDVLGSIASFVLGLAVALLGGLSWLILMVVFTAVGVLATRIGYARKEARRVAEDRGGERGLRNVLSNGLPAALAAFASVLESVPLVAAKVAFVTAVAAVTADTLASEVGGLASRVRMVLPPFARVPPGTNGGTSLLGQAAALAGAVIIGVLAVFLLGIGWPLAILAMVAGFLGCQFDSVLGATFEGDAARTGPLTKEDVNFLAGAVPAFIVLVVVTLSI